MKATYLVRDDDKAAQVEKFVQVLELHQLEVFGDATYQTNMRRQEKLRRPQELPGEEDVEKMKQYTIMRMSNMLADEYLLWDFHSFAELRDLVVSRLTLFNARRGGEPVRLTLMQWMDAENNSWLDKTRTEAFANDLDCDRFQEMKVTFQGGKGNNHVVPVLFPLDTIQGMRNLVEVRNQVGIPEENCYAFPYTQASLNHVSGWHSVKRIATAAEVPYPERLTATKMRHRVSTLYAAMNISEQDRQLFYKHMGHSSDINQHIYQAPLAEAEIRSVGSRLMELHGAVRPHTSSSAACATAGESSHSVPINVA